MFCAAWSRRHECFLNSGIQVLILQHVVEPPVLKNCSKDLTNTGCQGNWSEIWWDRRIVHSWAFPKKFDCSCLPALRNSLGGPAGVKKVNEGFGKSRAFLQNLVRNLVRRGWSWCRFSMSYYCLNLFWIDLICFKLHRRLFWGWHPRWSSEVWRSRLVQWTEIIEGLICRKL